MRLYLMQHALAYSAEEDAERPLNPDGVKQAKHSASGIKRLGLVFDLIMTCLLYTSDAADDSVYV